MSDRRYTHRSPQRWARAAAVAVGVFAPGVLLAHPGDLAAHSFAAGASHPWFGLDHLIAMVLVGFWAVQMGGRSRWLLPTTFVTAMIVGSFASGLFAMGGAVETFIALSVLMLGALVATQARMSAATAVAIVAAFAVMHGYAHGVEIPAGAARLEFTTGFALSTFTLHMLGLGLAAAATKWSAQGWLRAAGASAALAGAVLLIP